MKAITLRVFRALRSRAWPTALVGLRWLLQCVTSRTFVIFVCMPSVLWSSLILWLNATQPERTATALDSAFPVTFISIACAACWALMAVCFERFQHALRVTVAMIALALVARALPPTTGQVCRMADASSPNSQSNSAPICDDVADDEL